MWMPFGNVIGCLNHCLNSRGGKEGVHSSHLSLWPFLVSVTVWPSTGYCGSCSRCVSLPVGGLSFVSQPQRHCPLPELPSVSDGAGASLPEAEASQPCPRPLHVSESPGCQSGGKVRLSEQTEQ